MPGDNREVIEQIREQIDIVSLVERYVRLRQAGKNYSGLCPFHNEKTPSFIVSPDIQRYKCFGCGKSGDIFTFVEDIESISFYDVLQKFAAELGIELAKEKRNPQLETLEDINESAANFFHEYLLSPAGKKAYDYLTGRGMSREQIIQFKVGFAPGYGKLLQHLRKVKVYDNKKLQESGLFSFKAGQIRDRFIARVLFPIRSSSGKIVGFTGRVLPGDEMGPKYLNTPETPIFHKRSSLFGIFEARNSIRKNDIAVITEGTTDVISAHKVGIDYAVAPLGTGLTEQQLEIISRYSKNILFIFDSDQAGQKALERSFLIASSLNLNSYATTTDPYKDLDEMIQKEKDPKKYLDSKKLDAFTFILSSFVRERDLTKLSDFKATQKFIATLLEPVSEAQTLNFYKRKAEKMTGISFNQSDQRADTQAPIRSPQKGSETTASSREYYLINQIILNNQFSAAAKLEPKYFADKAIREIITYLSQNKVRESSQLYQSEELTPNARKLVEDIIFERGQSFPSVENDPSKALNEAYLLIQREYYQKLLRLYRQKQAVAEESEQDEQADDFMHKIGQLREKVDKINSRLGY